MIDLDHLAEADDGLPEPGPRRPPRVGELTSGWRLVTLAAWTGVVLAWSLGVWRTSVQLGLTTWWLGPRADPTPHIVRLAPFVLPVAVIAGAINNVRWLPLVGLAGAAVMAGYGVGDIGRQPQFALLELLIAGAAVVVSLASAAGMYRPARAEPVPAAE